MNRLKISLLVVLGAAALALPGAAIANHGESHGKANGHAKNGQAKGHGKARAVGYLFKGFYAGESSVEVKRGNAHVRKAGFIGETVEFDLSKARFVVRDTSGDGQRNIEDVAVGDWVLVKARLPRKDPGSAPFEVKWLIDKSNKPVSSQSG